MKTTTTFIFFLVALTFFFQSCSPTTASFTIPSDEAKFAGAIELNNKVDILFIVDNTSSMLQHQKRIAAQLAPLIADLNKLKMDYRFAVTTTSMGEPSQSCPQTSRSIIGNPRFLTENNITQLQERFVVGQSGCDIERGLDAMAHVISKNYLSTINSDFIRSDALLVVNFITDEEDKSTEYGDGSKNDFINILDRRKPLFKSGARGWIANFIGTLNQNVSCDQLGAPATIGQKYLRLVEASNGVKSSICNLDMTTTVANIRARIVGVLTSYRFPEEPNKSTIDVHVGGKRILEDSINGWTLITEGPTFILKFNGEAIPHANEPVVVNYAAARPR